MSFVYNEAKRAAMSGELNLDGGDIRIFLAMTNTSADTDDDANTIAGIGTPDWYDGSGYNATTGFLLAGEMISEDTVNNRAEFDANDLDMGTLGATPGTRSIAGMLLAQWNTDRDSSMPVAWIDAGFPINPLGVQVQALWNAEGILQALAGTGSPNP